MKSWNTAVTLRAPRVELELAEIDAVDLDRAALRVVEPAQQLGERRLARAVLPDDRERGPGRDREVEAVEHGPLVGVVRERDVAHPDLARGQSGGGTAPRRAARRSGAIAAPRRSVAATGCGRAVERPVQATERDRTRADRGRREHDERARA